MGVERGITGGETASGGFRRAGVTELPVADEFRPRHGYKVKVFDLRRFGVPYIPSMMQKGPRRTIRTGPTVWHVHKNCIELIYCTAGACEYESEGNVFRLSPGMMFVSRPHEAHRQLECPRGHAGFCMMFRPSGGGMARWFADALSRIPRLFSCRSSMAGCFGRILALAERGDTSLGSRLRLRTLVQSLILEIIDSAAISVSQKVPGALDAIAQRMRKHPEGDYPLDALMAESGVSKSSFIAMFKRVYGQPPRAYLLRCRIEEAKRFIEKGLAVNAVADMFGFSSPQHFSRTFKNFTGSTPVRWFAAEKGI